MPVVRITNRFVESIKVAGDTEFADTATPGLRLRVQSSGRKSWAMFYDLPTATKRVRRRMRLGDWPAIGLAEARKAALEIRASVARGRDPLALERAKRSEPLFEDLAHDYIQQHAKPRKRTWKRDEQRLKHDVLPVLGKRKASNITRSDIYNVLAAIERRGAKVQAQRVFETVRKLFRWAVDNERIATDPTLGIQRRAKTGVKDRWLSEPEIHQFWKALDATELDRLTITSCKLALATAARIGEVAGARAAEFDIKKRLWTIPPARVKNGRRHVIYLNNVALHLVKRTIEDAGNSEYLFPSRPRDRSSKPGAIQPLTPSSVAKAIKRKLKTLGFEKAAFTPHDLRRTALSHMARIGIEASVLSHVANHVSETAKTITQRVYIRHDYEEAKRRAFERWGDELEYMIQNAKPAAKVVKLRERLS
jgi:integrase